MNVLSSLRVVRFILAPALSFWIAGAGCMLGCESMVAAASPKASAESHSAGHHSKSNSTIVASGHACASQESHHCCQKNGDDAGPKSSQSKTSKKSSQSKPSNESLVASGGSSSSPMNCPFAMGRATVATKAQGGDNSLSPVPADSDLLIHNSREQLSPLSPPLRLPNRGHTYLRCCVFLI